MFLLVLYQEPIWVAVWLRTYDLQALWQHGNLMAVPIRSGLKHHSPRQGYPVLSEMTLTRAAAHVRNKHSELLLLHLRRRSNVPQRILISAKQQSDARRGSPVPPLEQPAWGACPFQSVPMPCIILAQMSKCHMQSPHATAPVREGCHHGDTLRPGPTWVFSE